MEIKKKGRRKRKREDKNIINSSTWENLLMSSKV
jgi:hypothetical protein